MSRLTRTAAVFLFGLAFAGGPSAGAVLATPASDYGASVRCRYEITQRGQYGWTEAQLRRIAVTPPQMAPVAPGQSVGWRYVVTRSRDRENKPFRVVYRSPIQKGLGDSAFTTMRAAISLPGDPGGDRFVWYRVTLKLFWYRSDGAVQNKVSHLMPAMHWIVGRHDFDTEDYCPGLEVVEVDG